ncbi:MAG: hypothetical protein H0V17_24990 [Deltaproteobacteria bacterium]|nr:hypothetical protein [Deltaproteobacteria bacterium]
MRIKGLVIGLLVFVPSVALADATPDYRKMASGDCARARAQNKTCVINIEGIDVEGKNPVGTGERITTPEFGTSKSLIRIRRDFIPEIIKTAEDLP